MHIAPGVSSALTFAAPGTSLPSPPLFPLPPSSSLILQIVSPFLLSLGVHFFYDFYPIAVEYSEKKASFFQFLTSVCAIIGGVFTVSRYTPHIQSNRHVQVK
jgi:hypothetical protein